MLKPDNIIYEKSISIVEVSMYNYNVSNDLIDCQMNSKDGDDKEHG